MGKNTFDNKEVDIIIERDGDNFTMSSSLGSPLRAHGSAEEVKDYFIKVINNTIESMKLNESKTITIHASWE